MRYDPCGRIVDMVRRPYRVACRPWRNSELEVTLHWYVTNPANGTLPYPCRINSLDWRPDNINPAPVGEVSFADRIFDGWDNVAVPMKGDHICGTRDDFVNGGVYDPDAVPLERDIDGIPTCCRPPIGGVVLGGEAVLAEPIELGGGGVALGGSAPLVPALCSYTVTSSSPVEEHVLAAGGPCGAARAWSAIDGSGWIMASTQPRGTVGNWTLLDTVGGNGWTTTAWDGLGCRVFTLSFGSWPGTVTVCLLA